MSDPNEPRQPPRPPHFTPPPDYPPTSQFPPVGADPGYAQPPPYDPSSGYPPPGYPSPPGYPPPGHPPPGYGPQPGPSRRSKAPLVALVLAITLLLCGGVVTASVILVNRAANKVDEVTEEARKAAEPFTDPTFPGLLPSGVPNLPGLPTDLPALPTDIPGLGEGKQITVTYEVSGDGPAEILYMEKLDGTPKRVGNAKLPWKITTTMKNPSVVSVVAVRSSIEAGSISCRATVDGEPVAEHTAEGGLATANCYKLVLN